MVNTLSNNKKNTKISVLYFFAVILLVVIIVLGYYRCPFNYIFGIPCPLCGMVRAIKYAFKFKFKEAFYYHAFWPLVLMILPVNFIVKKSNVKIDRKITNTIYIIIGILLLVYYILRHYYSSPIVRLHYEDSLLNDFINFLKNN